MNVKTVIHFSIGPLGSAAIGIVTLPLITWFFAVDDIGRYSMLQLAISFSMMVFCLGLDQAYVREFHDVTDKFVLLKSVIVPGGMALGLALMLLWLMPWSISDFLFDVNSEYLTVLLFLGMLITFNSRFLSLVLRMEERGLAYSASQMLPKLFFLLIIGVYVWSGLEPVFDNLMLAYVFSQVVVLVVLLANTRCHWIPAASVAIDITKLKAMMGYAAPLIASGFAFWALTAMDKFFLRSLSSFEELGIYSIAISFAGAGLILKAIFTTVWVPTVYKWNAEGIDPLKIKKMIDVVTLVIIVVWSLAGMLSWLLVYILPPEYEKIQSILLPAMAYPLLYTLSEVTGIGITIKRKTKYMLLVAMVSLIINGVGNYFLIPSMGATGAAISSAIAFFVFFVLKTEVSTMLWIELYRLKMYLVILAALILSITVNLIELSVTYRVVSWFSILALSFFMYRCQILGWVSMARNRVRR